MGAIISILYDRILLRFRVEVRWLYNLSEIKWLLCARAGSQTQSWSNIKACDDLVSLSIQIFVVKKRMRRGIRSQIWVDYWLYFLDHLVAV